MRQKSPVKKPANAIPSKLDELIETCLSEGKKIRNAKNNARRITCFKLIKHIELNYETQR